MHHRLASWLTAAMAWLLLAGPGAAAELSLMPVAVQLDRSTDRSTVRVTNNGSAPVVLQADAIRWHREAGVDRDEASDDLIVSPGVFTIGPGRTQVVRVGLRRTAASDREQTYRLVLREVPSQAAEPAMVQGNVRVLVTLRLPVYVAPDAVRQEQRWHARYDEQGRLVAQVTNHGNVHYRVAGVRVQGDARQAFHVTQGPESVVFPGEVRRFALAALAQADTARPVTLEVMTDAGLHHVALLPPSP